MRCSCGKSMNVSTVFDCCADCQSEYFRELQEIDTEERIRNQRDLEMIDRIPSVGDRVSVKSLIEFDPCESIDVGSLATVTEVIGAPNFCEEGDGITIRFDTLIDGLIGHDNCYTWYPECGPEYIPNDGDAVLEINVLEQFHYHCEFVNAIKNYHDGECPDCGEHIPDDVVPGEQCKNCPHIFVLPR